MGTVIVGDMNVHNPQWLKFSPHPPPEGAALRGCAVMNGLEQCVRVPTRGLNLLDLVLTELQ